MRKWSYCLALLLAAGYAQADTFVASDGFSGAVVKIDSQTGLSTPFTNLPSNGLGIAYNPTNNEIYARDFGTLYTIDPGTGLVSTVGASGSGITGLAFNPAFTTLYSVDQNSGNLYTVNPNTGAASLVGSTGTNTPLDLSTDPLSGALFASDIGGDIYTLNTTTGLATLVQPTVTNNLPDQGLTSISFDTAGNLFGVTLASNQLVKIDLATGTSVAVGPSLPYGDIRGMDVLPEVATPLPPVAGGGLVLLGVAVFRQRRRAV